MLFSRFSAVAVMAAVALCAACGSSRVTDAHTGEPAPLTCPATFVGTAPWVPDRPRGIDGTARIVPQQAPGRALICAYNVGASRPGSALTGTRHLAGRFADLAADLTWLPRQLAGASYACASVGLGWQTDYLLGLTYPTGTEWVSSTDDVSECTTTSNGRFTSQVNSVMQLLGQLLPPR